jgi:hypothetical protein
MRNKMREDASPRIGQMRWLSSSGGGTGGQGGYAAFEIAPPEDEIGEYQESGEDDDVMAAPTNTAFEADVPKTPRPVKKIVLMKTNREHDVFDDEPAGPAP